MTNYLYKCVIKLINFIIKKILNYKLLTFNAILSEYEYLSYRFLATR